MPAASAAWSQAECDPGNHEPWGRGALASRRPGWRRGELASCYERAAFGTRRSRRHPPRLGGETAVVIPMHKYHTLKALQDRASAEQVEEAEIDAAIAEHEAWKAAGRA
jgi:hypothetical protein